MAKRPARSRASTRLPKTLAGVITAIVLAVLAALGVKTDWFHKPSAPPTERPTAGSVAKRSIPCSREHEPPCSNLPYSREVR